MEGVEGSGPILILLGWTTSLLKLIQTSPSFLLYHYQGFFPITHMPSSGSFCSQPDFLVIEIMWDMTDRICRSTNWARMFLRVIVFFLDFFIFYIFHKFCWFSFIFSIFLCQYLALTPRGLPAPLIQLFPIYLPPTVPCDAPTSSALTVFSPLRFRCVFLCHAEIRFRVVATGISAHIFFQRKPIKFYTKM